MLWGSFHSGCIVILERKLQPEARPPSIRFRPPAVHIPLALLAAGWAVLLTGRALRWLAVHPRWTVVTVAPVWLIVTDTVLPALVLVCIVAGALSLWWALEPGSFTRRIVRPTQRELREWLTYRRHWQPAMLTSGLSLRENWGGDLPVLRSVCEDAGSDVLRVRMLPGQTLEQWKTATSALAQTFGARQVRVRRIPNRAQELELVVARRRGARIHHVTELPVEPVPQPATAARGAFPRQPRGGAA